MIVYVDEVRVEAWSSIGYGYGYNDSDQYIQFAGDHRLMRGLGEALRCSGWQIIRVAEGCKPWERQSARKSELHLGKLKS
jgi:hypothetical protein